MNDGAALQTTAIFNPALLNKEDLVRGFVARQDLLQRLLDDVRRVVSGTPPQHQLVIGQRGLGKTTLLRRLAFAIEDDPQLSAAWMPLVFPEEQYNVKNLGDFWLNCADALSDALDRSGAESAAEALDQKVAQVPIEPGQRSEAALQLLVDEAERLGRGLVLLVDNLDIVLDRLDQEQEWEFRRVISEEHRLYFIGASSRALEALYEHGRAFYDYFQVQDLKGLSDTEMFSLLGRLSTEQGDAKVQRILEEKPERVRALRVLTGGNPRTLMLLYRVLSQGPEGDVQRDIEQLLDLYTPLYKARFEEMASQAQQVVDAMAIHWDPITAGELAEKLAPLSVNQVSAQLKRLEDFGVVEKTPWFGEKKAAFQIAERFFNIWYLMRASRRVRRKLIWLVRFLEAWFEREELTELARTYLQRDPTAIGRERYAEMALVYAQTVQDRRLRRSLESAGLRAALDESVRSQFDFSDLPDEIQNRKERMTRLRKLQTRVMQMETGGVDPAQLWRLLGGSPQLSLEEKTRVVEELLERGSDWPKDLFARLERDDRRLQELFPKNATDIAKLYEALGSGEMTDAYDIDGALAVASQSGCALVPIAALASKTTAWSAPEAMSEAQIEIAENALQALASEGGYEAKALWLKGSLLLRKQQEANGAEQAYRDAIEIDPEDAVAWTSMGDLQRQNRRYQDAEQAYRRAIEIDPQNAYAWRRLGDLLNDDLQRFEKAESAYRRVIDLVPKDASAWSRLGMLLEDHLGRQDEAGNAYERALEYDPLYVFGWCLLGSHLRKTTRYKEAEEAYRQAIRIDDADPYAWTILGSLLEDHLDRYEEAEQSYRRAIAAQPRYAYAWAKLGNLLANRFKLYDQAEQAYRHSIEADPEYTYGWTLLGSVIERNSQRLAEAEQAYRKAIAIDAQYEFSWIKLAFLIKKDTSRGIEALKIHFRVMESNPDGWWRSTALKLARTLASTNLLPDVLDVVSLWHQQHSQDKEARFTLAGLFMLNGDWARAKSLLEEISTGASDEDQPEVWTFAAAVKAGHLDDVVELLANTGASERWRPLYEALRAVQAGSIDYLRRVAPEVRVVAEKIFHELGTLTTDQSTTDSSYTPKT